MLIVDTWHAVANAARRADLGAIGTMTDENNDLR
jgi:hypothetical protein